ncbi:N-acetylglucosamine-6-phosphate deacetylase [Devriesea agamarum]|uniref:N-acetylglucosamine-6-phosphate deacetylase n=1 Tax=Devriesea agamarum TaxID=472569 RepID=UPI000A0030A5|nr:N-acetylglucosamine-6-phosphate deacetylase [Devriesea agamarum]
MNSIDTHSTPHDQQVHSNHPTRRAFRGTAVLPDRVLPDALVLIEDQHISWVGPHEQAPEDARDVPVEVHDGLILPGLVDIHCHGGGGASFPDATDEDSVRTAIHAHRSQGTTSLVASLVTASPDTLRTRVDLLTPFVHSGELAGIHLEGPFISPHRCGAQNPAQVQDPDPGLTADLCARSGGAIRTMTIAPEQPGAREAIEALAQGGAIPSLGHTDAHANAMEAGLEWSLAALASGTAPFPLPTATHLFNGMRPIHHRDSGPVFTCLDAAALGKMVVELIADGVHTSAETIRYVFDIAAPGHVALITDAMAAAGMPDGQYELGSLAVTVEQGVATLTDGGAIAGGTARLLDVVRFAVRTARVELSAAVRAASLTPATVLGLSDQVGALRPGLRADLLLTGHDLSLHTVLRAGTDIE